MAIAKKMSQPAVKAPVETTVSSTVKIVSVTVEAFSETHAKMLAAAMNGIHENQIIKSILKRKPRPATTCESADFPQEGTRKWVTEYRIYAYASRVAIGLKKFEYLGKEFVKGGYDNKTDAVKDAKAFAIKHHVPMMVEIHKVLEKDDPVTLACEPKAGKGEYEISYRASE